MTVTSPSTLRRILGSALFVLLGAVALRAADTNRNFNVPAGEAAQTLKQFAAQAQREIVFSNDAIGRVRTNLVQGELTPAQALDVLLANTGLVATQDAKTGAIAVKKDQSRAHDEKNESSRPTGSRTARSEDGAIKLKKFEVMDSKLLNMDKPRSRDDAQPYVVFDRGVIETSGATNLEDFLKNRLPMETTVTSESQANQTSQFGARSSVNLRGLGTNQTLILVDGHRMAGAINLTTLAQPDLNGIPLSAVERIEILPTTASGIYGGGATGGVVNVILRRDYAGAEVKVTYANSFDTDSATRRVDLSAGYTLNGGKTNILLAASYSDGNKLLEQDRGFQLRNRQTIQANNPAYYPSVNPLYSATSNIRSTGGNLTLKPAYGGGALNSRITYVPYGYAGPGLDNGAGLIANAGKYNLDGSTGADFGSVRRELINSPTVESASATIRHQFSPILQGFLDLGASENIGRMQTSGNGVTVLSGSAAGNPFQQTIIVAYPVYIPITDVTSRSSDRRAVGGLIVKLPADWQAGADYSYSRSTLASRQQSTVVDFSAQLQSGAFNLFRDLKIYPIDLAPNFAVTDAQFPVTSSMRDAVIRASGPVWSLPGGRPTVSVLVEDRKEVAGKSAWLVNFLTMPERSQQARSAYAEINVPILGGGKKLPLVRELSLQLAARRDDYTTVGTNTPNATQALVQKTNKLTSTDPTLALRWVPVQDMALRASYGTGFLPPNITQLAPSPPLVNILGLFGLSDPRRGGTLVTTGDWQTGGNPNLKPELSETWSAGVILTPRAVPGLRLSVDWIKLDKTDNIVAQPDVPTLMANESLFPGRIVRGANLPGDLPGWAGPVTLFDGTAINMARASLEAYDIQLDYRLETKSAGTFDFFAVATRTMHFKTQVFSGLPVVENVGTSTSNTAIFASSFGGNYPLKFKGNAGVTWKRGAWSAGWTIRYFDSYGLLLNSGGLPTAAIILAQGNGGRVASQAYHDAYVGYRFGPGSGASGQGLKAAGAKLLQRTELLIGVKNVFNKSPAFDMTARYNGYADPRLASYYISLKKQF